MMDKEHIHYLCEDDIEKFKMSLRLTVCHYWASFVMQDGDPLIRFFLSHSQTYDIFLYRLRLSLVKLK